MAASKWMVSRRSIGGRAYYRVYRMRDAAREDTEPNREYYGSPTPDPAAAQTLADLMNEQAARG